MNKEPIKGITLTLRENPLHTKVEMTEEAIREFTYRVALQEIEEMMWSISFRIDEENTSLHDPKRALDEVRRFTKWSGHDEYPENSFEFWQAFANRNERLKYLLDALNEEHCGDCTAVACTCDRCWAESIAGIRTHPWPKMIGHQLSMMFRTPQDVDIDQQLKKRNNEYWEKYKVEKPESYAALQERWAKEKKEAEDVMIEHRRKLEEQNSQTSR